MAKDSYHLKGTIHSIGELTQRGSYYTRKFILTTHRKIRGMPVDNFIEFSAINDKAYLLDDYTIDEYVDVEFFIRGRMWKKLDTGKIINFTTLDVWNISALKKAVKKDKSQTSIPITDDENNNENNDITDEEREILERGPKEETITVTEKDDLPF